MRDVEAMAALIDALRPWHTRVVLVGGWAHRLHRLHPSAMVPRYRPVVTRDADVALDPRMPLQGNIAEALANAGFTKKLSGEHRPPVSHFQLGEDDTGFYVEFLSPLKGDGRSDDATAEAGGITTQKLRHLDLLLVAPWTLELVASGELPIADPARVQVANPVSFIAQKLLIHDLRKPDKRSQDLLYIHDTLELFGAHLPELNRLWREKVGPSLLPGDRKKVERLGRELFAVVSDAIREASRKTSADRRLLPEELRLRAEVGLGELFRTESDLS